MLKCIITGSSGYVGGEIARFLESRDIKVIELSRRESVSHLRKRVSWTLGQIPDEKIEADALIHCAWDMKHREKSIDSSLNRIGTLKLFKYARDCGVKKLIFISSISAYHDTKSIYGKTKLKCEQDLQSLGVIVVRPGLVFGGRNGGMYGKLERLVRNLPIIPLLDGGAQRLYLCPLDTLCDHIINIICKPNYSAGQNYVVANQDGPTLRQILEQIAAEHSKRRLYFSLPARWLFLILRSAEFMKIPLPFNSDSLTSLLHQDPAPSFFRTSNDIYK